MTAGWDAKTYASQFNFVPEYGRALIDILAPQAGEKILDLGCGTGALTAELAAKGCDVTGIDQDANMIALAQQTYPALTFVQQDAQNVTLTQTFDAVFSNAALHWMDIGKVFPQLANVLRAGGRMAAEMGGIHNIATVERAIYAALDKLGYLAKDFPAPWHFPSPATVAQKLEQAGFEVRYTHLYDRPTLLKAEAGGLAGWVKMFGRAFLDKIPVDKHAAFFDYLEQAGRPAMFRDGQWYADYRRFHFVAVKL